MGYMHIGNLYREQDILMFKECYALEKIHGTSAHIGFKSEEKSIYYFSGGEKHEKFKALFNEEELLAGFLTVQDGRNVTVYGEAYGGSCQRMSATYGKELKFVVFDVKIGDSWLCVPQAEAFAKTLGLEFVFYSRIYTTIDAIDSCRDADSVQAIRNGCGEGKKMEGVVLRPLIEVTDNRGNRIMAKHKRDEFRETASPRVVEDIEKLKVLQEADLIVQEWVTQERLKHVLDKLPQDINVDSTGKVIADMIADVYREAKGEIVESEAVRKAIGKKTAGMFKQYVKQKAGL